MNQSSVIALIFFTVMISDLNPGKRCPNYPKVEVGTYSFLRKENNLTWWWWLHCPVVCQQIKEIQAVMSHLLGNYSTLGLSFAYFQVDIYRDNIFCCSFWFVYAFFFYIQLVQFLKLVCVYLLLFLHQLWTRVLIFYAWASIYMLIHWHALLVYSLMWHA